MASMRSITLGTCAAILLASAGCEKAGPHGSGKLTADERGRLAHLPADADFVFGGNVMRLQKLFDGPLVGDVLRQAEAFAPGMRSWVGCFAAHDDLVMTGAVKLDGLQMRFVMKGMTIDDLARCAAAAHFTSHVDPDRRFITIETRGALAHRYGYLVLDDGSIYGKQELGLVFVHDDASNARSALEADVATTAKRDVTANAALAALIERADRSRGIWLAGSAADTPFGDQLGAVVGSLDLGDDGLRVDLDLDTHGGLARDAVESFEQARSAAAMLGPELSDVLSSIELSRSGDRLHVSARLTSRHLAAVSRFAERSGALRGDLL